MRRLTAVLILISATHELAAQEAPTTGLLYNTKEHHSLSYSCTKSAAGTLECEFTQVAVRKKAKPEDLAKRLADARKEFPNFKVTAEECKNWTIALDVIEGRAKAPTEPPRPITSMERKDYSESLEAILKLCTARTEENLLAVIRIGHAKDVRTCMVSSNTYKQTFRPVTDGSSTVPAWVVAQGQAEGPCGVVNLSRLEVDKATGGTYRFWQYTARKAVTNPKGTAFGIACKDLDEREYLYDWKGEERSVGCDYIEFSPL